MENFKLINLRDLRVSKNLTQEELGRELGFTKSAISNYENGNRIPDINVLILYSRFFNVSIDYIVQNENFASTDCSDVLKNTPSIESEVCEIFATLDTAQKNQVLGFIHGIKQSKNNLK